MYSRDRRLIDKVFNDSSSGNERQLTAKELGVAGGIAAATIAAAIGVGELAQNEQQDRIRIGNEIVADRRLMTPQEAAEFGAKQARENAERQKAYEAATNPDEMTVNGDEVEIGEPLVITNPDLGVETGQIAGEAMPTNNSEGTNQGSEK